MHIYLIQITLKYKAKAITTHIIDVIMEKVFVIIIMYIYVDNVTLVNILSINNGICE